jgi:hypothetical protein
MNEPIDISAHWPEWQYAYLLTTEALEDGPTIWKHGALPLPIAHTISFEAAIARAQRVVESLDEFGFDFRVGVARAPGESVLGLNWRVEVLTPRLEGETRETAALSVARLLLELLEEHSARVRGVIP